MGKTKITPKAQAKAAAATKGNFGKRLKAKVGKRAPKAANYTDTAFKTASVKVQSQDALSSNNRVSSSSGAELNGATLVDASNESLDIVSSRGNTLEQLSSQLYHHAPAARISAIKGILDALRHIEPRGQSLRNVLEANLSTLFPLLSRCFVDTDDTVREISTECLQFVYETLLNIGSNCVELLEPFLPLHVAYLSSAFNSLVGTVRRDALKSVFITTTFFLKWSERASRLTHSTSALSSTSALYSHKTFVDRLLPSFGRLLSSDVSSLASPSLSNQQRIDQTLALSTSKKNRGKKEKKASGSAPTSNKKEIDERCHILRSFLSLLRWNEFISLQGAGDATMRDDLTCLVGNYGENGKRSLLIHRNRQGAQIPVGHSFSSIQYLEEILEFDTSSPSRDSVAHKTQTIHFTDAYHSILKALCERWVALNQQGYAHGGELFLHSLLLEEAALLMTVLRLFWNRLVAPVLRSDPGAVETKKGKGLENLRSSTELLFKLISGAFPVRDNSSNSIGSLSCCSVNAEMCCFFADISREIPSLDNSWVEKLHKYLLTDLERKPKRGAPNDSKCQTLRVVSVFLLDQTPRDGDLLLSTSQRHELLKSLQTSLSKRNEATGKMLKLENTDEVGVLSYNLLCNLVLNHEMLKDNGESSSTLIGLAMLLADCLEVETNFAAPDDAVRVLYALRQFCERLHALGMAREKGEIESSIRQKIYFLFRAPKSTKTSKCQVSPFERMSRSTQQSIISYIAALQSPTREVSDALGKICWRIGSQSNFEHLPIVVFIHEVIFKIRRSMDFAAYVNFLVQGSIFGARLSKSRPISHGCTTELLCRYVIRAGPSKMLVALQPILHDCLNKFNDDDKCTVCSIHAALILFAACYVDGTSEDEIFRSIVQQFITNDDFINSFLLFCLSIESQDIRSSLLQPFVLLLSLDSSLSTDLVSTLDQDKESEPSLKAASTTRLFKEYLKQQGNITKFPAHIEELLKILPDM